MLQSGGTVQRYGGTKDDGRVRGLLGVGLYLTATLQLLHREISKSFRLCPLVAKARSKAPKLLSISSLTQDELMSRRWSSDKPETAEWYYGEPIKDVTKSLKAYPPDNVNFSDAWVVAIVNSSLSREDRGTYWPSVFLAKGLLRTT